MTFANTPTVRTMCSRKSAANWIAQTFALFPTTTCPPSKEFTAALIDMLTNYTEAIVAEVLSPSHGLPVKYQFLPTLKEFKQEFEAVAEALRRRFDQMKRRQEQFDARNDPVLDEATKERIMKGFEELKETLAKSCPPHAENSQLADGALAQVFVPEGHDRYAALEAWAATTDRVYWKYGMSSDKRRGLWVSHSAWVDASKGRLRKSAPCSLTREELLAQNPHMNATDFDAIPDQPSDFKRALRERDELDEMLNSHISDPVRR